MIDTFNLEQVLRVELRPNMMGTKVLRLALGEGENLDLLEPVRSAIGASLVTTLMSNDFNLLVEGASDKPILEAALALFQPTYHTRIVINGSVSETGKLLPLFYERAGLPFAVYLDADSGARDLRGALIKAGVSSSKIVYLGDVIRRDDDFELEDIFDPVLYDQAVQRTYSNKLVHRPPDGAASHDPAPRVHPVEAGARSMKAADSSGLRSEMNIALLRHSHPGLQLRPSDLKFLLATRTTVIFRQLHENKGRSQFLLATKTPFSEEKAKGPEAFRPELVERANTR